MHEAETKAIHERWAEERKTYQVSFNEKETKRKG